MDCRVRSRCQVDSKSATNRWKSWGALLITTLWTACPRIPVSVTVPQVWNFRIKGTNGFFYLFHFKNSTNICIKSCFMVNAGTSSNFGKPGFGISTWPLTADNPLQAMKSKSSPGGTLDRVDLSVMSTKLHHSDGNLSYHVDDPPSLVAGKIIAYHYHIKNLLTEWLYILVQCSRNCTE